MNSADGWGNGGDIRPSARKSIHSHSCCPFARGEVVMGRYGLKEMIAQKNNTFSSPTMESGHDEVDNIISKPQQSTSAIFISQKKNKRRNSLNSDNQDYQEEDSKMLSKSLPEKCSPHLYCSDESHTEENSKEISHHSQYQSFESNQSFSQSYSNETELPRQLPRSESRCQFKKEPSLDRDVQTKSYFIKYPILVGIICVLAYVFSDLFSIIKDKNIVTSGNNNGKMKFYNDMSAIGKMYKLNQDSILQLQVGIASISEREDTDSFIFVYDSKKQNFNSTVFHEFINEIALLSARYLRNESASARHVMVDTSSIIVKNSDELIHKYSDDITKGGVMVMKAIDMLPSSLAMALHYYCDVFNPLVKKSAMFFTLDIANCSDKMSTHSYIEKCLKRKWSSVSSEFIGPLLARVVSVVVDVTDLF